MAERIYIITVPTGETEGVLAGTLNQFFEINPEITIRDVAMRLDERKGHYRYQFVLLYSDDGGTQYRAAEFSDEQGGTTANYQLQAYFFDHPELDPLKVWITSKQDQRFGGITRLLAFAQFKAQQYKALGPTHYPVVAAESVAAGTDGQFKQESNVDPNPDRLEATNLGGLPWPSQIGGVALVDVEGNKAGTNCCGVAGVDDTSTLPTPPVGAVCDNSGPPPYRDPPEPPPDRGGCLRYDHVCQCIADVDTWVLVSIECVNNALCQPFLQTCDHQNAHFEQQGACIPGDPLPAVVPDPLCDPICCDDPPDPPNCCLHAVFDCVCVENSGGEDESRWSLTTLECIDNALCEPLSFTLSDEDADGRIDHCEYEEQAACECGERDQDVLMAGLEAPFFIPNPNAPPDKIPFIEPECCDTGCCVKLSYVCVDDGGVSTWIFANAECVDNDECSGSGIKRTCENGLTFTVENRDTCDCSEKGPVAQAVAEGVFPGEPQDCDADCADRGCEYTWESTYNCDTDTWSDPVLVLTECVYNPTATDWADKDGEYCVKTKVTTENKCSTDDDCPSPSETPLKPVGDPAEGCCNSCVFTWESTYDCDTFTWSDPVLVNTECLASPSPTAWGPKGGVGNECVYTRKTVEGTCDSVRGCA